MIYVYEESLLTTRQCHGLVSLMGNTNYFNWDLYYIQPLCMFSYIYIFDNEFSCDHIFDNEYFVGMWLVKL